MDRYRKESIGRAQRRFATSLRPAVSILAIIVGVFAGAASAQQDVDDTYPPPPKVMSDQEKSQLEAADSVKKRTKLALEMMDARMTKAEAFHDSKKLDAMFVELGAFHALIDHTFAYLDKSDNDSNKVLNNFKRLEIGLRRFMPRLEVIRRDLPVRYEFYPRLLVRYIRETRSRAIEPLFSDTVVPNSKP